MKHRTNDVSFFPCPICGRKPFVSYYPPNSGWASCKGTIFHPHDVIIAHVKWENPSNLVQRLASNWNQGQFIDFGKSEDEEP